MDTTTERRPRSRSAIRGGARLSAAKRAWSFAFDVVGDAKTADGWTPAALRWLIRAIALGAVCLVARVGIAAAPFLADEGIAAALYAPLFALFLIYALLSPAVYAMMFRLRARRGLRSAIASAALYAPIFGLAASAVMAVSLSSPLSPFADGGGSASGVSFGNWTAFALIMGAAASALTALAHRMGQPPAPPPAVTARRFYAPIEITASIAALVCLLTAPLWAG